MTTDALRIVLDHGLRVFPCRPGGKDPLTDHGCKDATDDRAQIREWQARWPDANWGAATGGGIFALDIDMKNGLDGGAALAAMIDRHGNLPRHLVNRTPNSGTHHLFRGDGIRNSAGKIAPGFDVRGDGGYICVPPSRLATGDYSWLDPAAPIPVAPEWLLAELAAAKSKRVLDAPAAVPEGKRNDTLYRFACALRAKAMLDDVAWTALQARNLDCDPPLHEGELRKIFEGAWRHPPGFATTDLGNRDRLVAARGEDLRFLVGAGWHVWTGQRFEPDDSKRVIVMMGDVARGIYAEAAAADDLERRKALSLWARTSEGRARIEAAAALAESHPEVVDRIENFDTDPGLLGVKNGVVELDTGMFRPADRADRVTKQADVHFDPSATAPRWQQFQLEVHGGDQEVVEFMQRAWGYTLSGHTDEQVFFIKYGDGENGKGVEQEVLAAVLGDYALAIEPETLMKKTSGGQNAASSDIAEMRGARFIYTSELEDGQELAEKLVKRLTGQDTIRARFLYRERFSFKPVAKFWISTNHRPEIRGTDHAIWRRVRLVPYSQRFTDRKDPRLASKLLAERAGILNWLIAGYQQWRQNGLGAPKAVLSAGQQFRTDMDQLGAFLEECTRPVAKKDTVLVTKAADVYRRYVEWAKDNRCFPILKARQFHEQMERNHGHHRVKHDSVVYPGLLLVAWERRDDRM